MPEAVDVAVVGGGVIGLSVARELRLAGVDLVLVLEREAAVGQGSSSRANGGVRAQFTTGINVAFSAFSIIRTGAEVVALEPAAGGGVLVRTPHLTVRAGFVVNALEQLARRVGNRFPLLEELPGVMHAPAAGRAVAELVTLGRCRSFDLHHLRPSRFAEGVETAVL